MKQTPAIFPWILGAGDMCIFILFALLGRHEHSESMAVSTILETSFPFMLAWLAAGWIFKTFDPLAVASTKTAVTKVLATWAAAGPIGLLLRALFLWRGIPIAFAVVVLVFNFVFLTIWRASFSLLFASARKQRS